MAARHEMTLEELQNNYEFKVATRMIKKEFPWVKEIILPDSNETLNEYNIIFLGLLIDVNKVHEEYEWVPNSWVNWNVSRYGSYSAPYMSTIFDISYREGEEPIEDMIQMAKSVHKSVAIPSELKLPEGRTLSFSNFVVDDTLTPQN